MQLARNNGLVMPAFLAWSLLGWPISEHWPTIPEAAMDGPSLLFVAMLWYWVGLRFDLRWGVTDKTPWIALVVFTLVSLGGAFIPIGYVGYLPYGFVVWVTATLTISRCTYRYFGLTRRGLNENNPRC